MIKKTKYTKKQNEEAEFHDKWGDSTEIDKIDIRKYFSAEAAIDYRLAIKLLGDIKGKKVLDLGCGFGEATVFFALEGASVTALDISPKMLQCVRKLSKRYKVERKIKYIESPAEKIPVKTETIDLIFGGNVLHHVDVSLVSKEIKRVLKKNGKAIFIEPLGYNPAIQIYRYLASDVRTKMERPFTFKDVKILGRGFKKVTHQEQQLFTTLIFVWFLLGERLNPGKVRYWKRIIDQGEKYERSLRLLNKIDSFVLKIPLVNYLCWNTVIQLIK